MKKAPMLNSYQPLSTLWGSAKAARGKAASEQQTVLFTFYQPRPLMHELNQVSMGAGFEAFPAECILVN